MELLEPFKDFIRDSTRQDLYEIFKVDLSPNMFTELKKFETTSQIFRKIYILYACMSACADRNLESTLIPQYVSKPLFIPWKDSFDPELFALFCANGFYRIVCWNKNLCEDIHYQNEKAFRLSCRYGHFDVAKFLIECGVDIHAEDDEAFIHACSYGNLEIVELFASKGANIYTQNYAAFRFACQNGHLEVAQYLINFGADIHAAKDYAFRYACANGHLHIAQFLLTRDRIDIHACQDHAFRYACGNGHSHVVAWLIYLSCDGYGPINMKALDDYAFRYSCLNGHPDIAGDIYRTSGISKYARDFVLKTCDDEIKEWVSGVKVRG